MKRTATRTPLMLALHYANTSLDGLDRELSEAIRKATQRTASELNSHLRSRGAPETQHERTVFRGWYSMTLFGRIDDAQAAIQPKLAARVAALIDLASLRIREDDLEHHARALLEAARELGLDVERDAPLRPAELEVKTGELVHRMNAIRIANRRKKIAPNSARTPARVNAAELAARRVLSVLHGVPDRESRDFLRQGAKLWHHAQESAANLERKSRRILGVA